MNNNERKILFNMDFVLLALVCFGFHGVLGSPVFNEAQKEIIVTNFNDCSKTTSVDLDILMRARNNDFTEDDALKAYYMCMFLKMQFIDAEGHYSPAAIERIRNFLHLNGDPESWNHIVSACFGDIESIAIGARPYHAIVCFTDKIGGKIEI